MSRWDCVIHHTSPAPAGLVAHFVVQEYVEEPSARAAYEAAYKAWQEHPEATKARPGNGAEIKVVSAKDDAFWKHAAEHPKMEYRKVLVTKEYDVPVYGTYDSVCSEDRYVKNSKEIARERSSGACINWYDGELIAVPFVEQFLPGWTFLGLELNGQPYGSRYHLNARRDLGEQAPYGFTWIDNQGHSLKDAAVYTPNRELPRLPTLLDVNWRSEKPLEEGSRFVMAWEAEGADVPEEFYVNARFFRKVESREHEEQHARAMRGSPEEVLKRTVAALERQKAKELEKYKAKLDADYQKELEEMKKKIYKASSSTTNSTD